MERREFLKVALGFAAAAGAIATNAVAHAVPLLPNADGTTPPKSGEADAQSDKLATEATQRDGDTSDADSDIGARRRWRRRWRRRYWRRRYWRPRYWRRRRWWRRRRRWWRRPRRRVIYY
jgi:hypothetical protein